MKVLIEALLLVMASLTAVAVNAKQKTQIGSSSGTPNHHKEVHYHYRYAIDDPQSGVVSTQWEDRHGEYVKGSYSLVEPDGQVRHVDYEVDGPHGFHAVIRTTPPVNSLLSIKQLQKSHQVHKEPLINVLTRRAPGTSQRTGRVLPINYHSAKPDYYLAFAKGEPANYQNNQPALEAPDVEPAPMSGSATHQEVQLAARDSQSHHSIQEEHSSAHTHHKPQEEYVIPSVEGVTYPRRNNGGNRVATGSSVSNIRTYYAANRGDLSIPRIPSTDILPPTEERLRHPLQTQIIFTPYTDDYFDG